MEPEEINTAVVAGIKDSAVPRIDKDRILEVFGQDKGEGLFRIVSDLVHEAVRMPIEWGTMSLEEGVNDILVRFHGIHPELSQDALHEIGRCVGWNLR